MAVLNPPVVPTFVSPFLAFDKPEVRDRTRFEKRFGWLVGLLGEGEVPSDGLANWAEFSNELASLAEAPVGLFSLLIACGRFLTLRAGLKRRRRRRTALLERTKTPSLPSLRSERSLSRREELRTIPSTNFEYALYLSFRPLAEADLRLRLSVRSGSRRSVEPRLRTRTILQAARDRRWGFRRWRT